MKVKITRLNENELRVLREVERLIAYWEDCKPFSNREQPAWDMCISIIRQLEDLKRDILGREE